MPVCLLPQSRSSHRTTESGCFGMSVARYRKSLEESKQFMWDQDYLLPSIDDMQSDNDQHYRCSQYKSCSRHASRKHLVLTLLPWILTIILLVCLVVTINRMPEECVENMFWRELEFGIFFHYDLRWFMIHPLHLFVLIVHMFPHLTGSNMFNCRDCQKGNPAGATHTPVSSRSCIQ
jgi:hypothetical protein